jgi:hypothetical protein
MIRLLLKIFSKQTLAEFLSEKADEIIEYIEPERPKVKFFTLLSRFYCIIIKRRTDENKYNSSRKMS